mmetsp:Transcript_48779/g.122163  ORF Transcript_48779/g.122163 Transcript_48779/m.122163 type:complete len:129 (-) Transcript_48779:81-467(-)
MWDSATGRGFIASWPTLALHLPVLPCFTLPSARGAGSTSSLYEDLYVHEEHRKSGIGKMLLRAAIELSARLRCARLDWQALDWNQPALTFYQHKIGAEQMREWIYHRLSAESMAAFLEAEQIRDSSDR